MTQNLATATGCAAGATESFVVVPFELVKIKYVLNPSLDPWKVVPKHECRLQDKSSTFAGPMDVVRKVVQQEGLLGQYHGSAQMRASEFTGAVQVCTPAWKQPCGGMHSALFCCHTHSHCHRHFWWNGGYFGCIFQVRSLLPKAEVRHSQIILKQNTRTHSTTFS